MNRTFVKEPVGWYTAEDAALAFPGYRNIVETDRDKIVNVGGRSGKLLATWGGFAWVAFDQGREPESWPMVAVWIALPR